MYDSLIKAALYARAFSYSPYSNFRVGAAVLTYDGRIFTGANVENASYGAAICAERTAFVKAVSEGSRDFTMAAVAANEDDYCVPCGICLQFISEFCCADTFEVICVKTADDYKVFKLKELLPHGFVLKKEAEQHANG